MVALLYEEKYTSFVIYLLEIYYLKNKTDMKRNVLTTADIQKEQLFLVQLERELNTVLTKINENLNSLKVEELQLRSQAVNMLAPEKTSQKVEAITKQEAQPVFNDNPEVVNQQEIDLDILLKNINEEDED